mmetsp:Transcript_19349/g.53182  ORF Transcript_19349/g.53182 Transcript_19349/m.53182 type:complete len:413 (+) Transcript_19349:352-1590(+)
MSARWAPSPCPRRAAFRSAGRRPPDPCRLPWRAPLASRHRRRRLRRAAGGSCAPRRPRAAPGHRCAPRAARSRRTGRQGPSARGGLKSCWSRLLPARSARRARRTRARPPGPRPGLRHRSPHSWAARARPGRPSAARGWRRPSGQRCPRRGAGRPSWSRAGRCRGRPPLPPARRPQQRSAGPTRTASGPLPGPALSQWHHLPPPRRRTPAPPPLRAQLPRVSRQRPHHCGQRPAPRARGLAAHGAFRATKLGRPVRCRRGLAALRKRGEPTPAAAQAPKPNLRWPTRRAAPHAGPWPRRVATRPCPQLPAPRLQGATAPPPRLGSAEGPRGSGGAGPPPLVSLARRSGSAAAGPRPPSAARRATWPRGALQPLGCWPRCQRKVQARAGAPPAAPRRPLHVGRRRSPWRARGA